MPIGPLRVPDIAKDMGLVLELAESLDTELPLCELTTKTYREACEAYGNDANHLMAVRLLEEANDQLLRGRG